SQRKYVSCERCPTTVMALWSHAGQLGLAAAARERLSAGGLRHGIALTPPGIADCLNRKSDGGALWRARAGAARHTRLPLGRTRYPSGNRPASTPRGLWREHLLNQTNRPVCDS